MKYKLAGVSAFGLIAFIWVRPLFGAVQANIKIDQVSSSVYGKWTLIATDGSARTSTDTGVDKKSHSIALTEFGQLTLSVTPPPGMSVKITVYRLGEVVSVINGQQTSVEIFPNDNYRFLIQYSLSKLGSLGVTSDPSGIRFRLKGKIGRNFTKKTPFTFQNLPSGQYTMKFSAPEGCLPPPPRTVQVEEEKRITIHQTFNCDAQDESGTVDRGKSKRQIRQEAEEREFKPRGERK